MEIDISAAALFTVAQANDSVGDTPAHFVVILPAGGEVGEMILRLHSSVKACDDAVLGDIEAETLYIIARNDSHRVVCADYRIGYRAVLCHEPAVEHIGRGGFPEISVADIVLIEFYPVRFEGAPEGVDTALGEFIPLYTGYHKELPCAVDFDDVAAYPLKGVGICERHIDTAGYILVDRDNGDIVRLAVFDDVMYEALVANEI